jgi:DNA (cytosine-5)-methyltransferase 1
MNVLDLFSGIGGFSLGLERAGMRTIAFCEIDLYCQAVLRKHWPDVPVFGDVRELTVEALADAHSRRQSQLEERNGKPLSRQQASCRHNAIRCDVDLICGGFPCQDISVAGKGAGIEGSRSGLWSEYARIIGEVRPRYVIVENVAALLGRGIERILGDLAALGFDAEWHCIPASAVGAPHRRDRVWIIADRQENPSRSDADRLGSHRAAEHIDGGVELRDEQISELGSLGENVAHAARHVRGEQAASRAERERVEECGEQGDVADAASAGFQKRDGLLTRRQVTDAAASTSAWWLIEPDVGRVAHGVSSRVDRLRALGNSIIPQIAEIIGRAIMEREGTT